MFNMTKFNCAPPDTNFFNPENMKNGKTPLKHSLSCFKENKAAPAKKFKHTHDSLGNNKELSATVVLDNAEQFRASVNQHHKDLTKQSKQDIEQKLIERKNRQQKS